MEAVGDGGMTRLYLIRHAEAEGNLYRVAHGHCNGLITNYRGYQQIDALRERFRKVDIDAVYSSDLYRTQITARAIWLPKALPLHLEPAFREICMGEWEDHTWHELNVRYPEEMYNFNRRADLWRVPGAETAQQVVDRFIPALERVARRHEGGAVAVFSHGMALRTVLGDHAHQAGSLVEEDRLRYDFTHFSAVTAEELREVSRLVSEQILAGLDVDVREMPIEEAKKLGAMALFGEKYGDVVRVVSAGDFSVELCGGTHADNTAKLGLFKIVSESSVAAGIRRITAVTGFGVLKHIENDERIMQSAAAAMKLGNVAELDKRAATLSAEVKAKDRELAELRGEISALKAGSLMDSARQVGGVRLITAEVEVSNPGELRSMCDTARDNGADIVAVFAGVNKEKGTLNFACACGADAIKLGAHAGNIVRETAKIAGGSGGGKPDSAMAGAKDASKADEALASVDSIVSAMLK